MPGCSRHPRWTSCGLVRRGSASTVIPAAVRPPRSARAFSPYRRLITTCGTPPVAGGWTAWVEPIRCTHLDDHLIAHRIDATVVVQRPALRGGDRGTLALADGFGPDGGTLPAPSRKRKPELSLPGGTVYGPRDEVGLRPDREDDSFSCRGDLQWFAGSCCRSCCVARRRSAAASAASCRPRLRRPRRSGGSGAPCGGCRRGVAATPSRVVGRSRSRRVFKAWRSLRRRHEPTPRPAGAVRFRLVYVLAIPADVALASVSCFMRMSVAVFGGTHHARIGLGNPRFAAGVTAAASQHPPSLNRPALRSAPQTPGGEWRFGQRPVLKRFGVAGVVLLSSNEPSVGGASPSQMERSHRSRR